MASQESKEIHVNATTPEQIQAFLDIHGGVAILDFHAAWCGPCYGILPKLKQLSRETGIGYIKIDVDEAEDLAAIEFGVDIMPTFFLVKGEWDRVLAKNEGTSEANLKKMFQLAVAEKNSNLQAPPKTEEDRQVLT